MKLVMDLVVNHTSDEHPWFVESRSSRDNPKRDWYWWRPQPNNWGSFFSGSAWELDPLTGEHYLHLFSRKQPDLNWENPDVRAAVYAMMNWWLDRGVDGFRMDVIDLISKDPALPDGERARRARCTATASRTRAAARGSTSSWRRCTARCSPGATPEPLTVGEMPTVTLEQARLFTDPARAELDMVFQFEHVQARPGRDQVGAAPAAPARAQGLARALAGRARGRRLEQPLLEQPRPAARRLALRRRRRRTASRAAKMLATVLHLHRGTPYVYQGEELGMTNAPWSGIEDFRDIETLNHYAEAVAQRRRARRRCWRCCAPAAATTRARRCSGTPRRTPASRPARRGCRSTRTTREINAERRARTPTPSSTTTAG